MPTDPFVDTLKALRAYSDAVDKFHSVLRDEGDLAEASRIRSAAFRTLLTAIQALAKAPAQ